MIDGGAEGEHHERGDTPAEWNTNPRRVMSRTPFVALDTSVREAMSSRVRRGEDAGAAFVDGEGQHDEAGDATPLRPTAQRSNSALTSLWRRSSAKMARASFLSW